MLICYGQITSGSELGIPSVIIIVHRECSSILSFNSRGVGIIGTKVNDVAVGIFGVSK